SKSTIANIRQIYSVDKSFSGTGTISFYQTHKEVHVSRHYQSLLKENLRNMR
ncbi:LytTR family transcriptional regulator DNA-binding domain-containing protein, partial [Streptococcus pneumoniae]